jgi:TIGR00341 family protein
VYEAIEALSVPSRSFYILVAISTVIAAFGLLSNSTAVVIGAMLVAPLMGPIFGTALSLATGDQRLMRRAASSELMGMLLAVLIGALIGLIPLQLGFGSEIMARTQPTLYDIIVALASGFAGAYAMVDKKVSPALPGVAIATALVPPLTTCGLCLAAARWEWALGAFLLFFANFLAIQVAAAGVFSLLGMTAEGPQGPAPVPSRLLPVLRRFGPSLVMLAGVSVFMTFTLVRIVRERRLEQAVETTLAEGLRTMTGAQLSEVRLGPPPHGSGRRGVEVVATVLAPQEVTPRQVADLERAIVKSVEGVDEVHLVVRSLLSRDADRDGPVFLADTERERRAVVEEQTRFLSEATRVLSERVVATAPGAQLADLYRGEAPPAEGAAVPVTATVRTPVAFDPAQVASMEAALVAALGQPVRLTVRSVLTRDADAQQFLYEPREEARPLSESEAALRRRLEGALRRQAAAEVFGATLSELRFREDGGRLLVLAVVRTPESFRPGQVRRIQAALRQHVHPGIQLIVRSTVAADATAESILSGFDDAKLAE